jgi:hypothetical protein
VKSRRRPASISDVSRTNRNALPAGGGASPISGVVANKSSPAVLI